MKIFLFLLPLSLLAQEQASKAYTALQEVAFFDGLRKSPTFKECLPKKDVIAEYTVVYNCVTEKLSSEANQKELEEIFLDNKKVKSLPSNARYKYVLKNLKKKFKQDLLGSNLTGDQLQDAFRNSKISFYDLRSVYLSQLKKNKYMHLSHFCLTRKNPDKKNIQALLIEKFNEIKSAYDVKKIISDCTAQVKKNKCEDASANSTCILRLKLTHYNNAIEKLEESQNDLKGFLKNVKELEEEKLTKAVNISSKELVNAYTNSDDEFYSDQADLIEKHCIQNFDEKKCSKIVEFDEKQNYVKLKLKLEIKAKNDLERTKKMNAKELIEYLKSTGNYSSEKLKQLEELPPSELNKHVTNLMQSRRKSIIENLQNSMRDNALSKQDEYTDKEMSSVKGSVESKGEMIESLTKFSNALQGVVDPSSDGIDREVREMNSDDKDQKWLEETQGQETADKSIWENLKEFFSFE